jgi:hypothetical protein
LDDSKKTQPFDKVFSSEFAKNCFKGMTEAAEETRAQIQIKTVVASTEEVE